MFSACAYNSYYWLNYINSNRCPDLNTDQCIGLRENCGQYYVVINGIPAKCIMNEYNFCSYNEDQCFTDYKKLNVILSLSGTLSYFILFLLNFFLREKVKKEYNIEGEYDSCASTICSPCGLAQEYREIESVGDVYLQV
jgi:Cys-rich protein (TIGR01571 family)